MRAIAALQDHLSRMRTEVCPPEMSQLMEPASLQRADGALEIEFIAASGETRLKHLFQSDPCRALFPYPETADLGQTILLTTSGGLAGGDRIRMDVRCGREARQVFTPQAAEKIYRTINAPTEITVSLVAAAGSWLEWVPQETILFERSHLRRRVAIDVEEGGALLAGDILSFGRAAHGEAYDVGRLFDRWEVRRGGRLVWADRLRLDDPKAALAHPAGFAGARAYGTILHRGREPGEALLQPVRALAETLQSRIGATLIGDLLVVRFLAPTTAVLRGDYGKVWCLLRSAAGGLPSRMPRIWHT